MLFRAFKTARLRLNSQIVGGFSELNKRGMKDWQYLKHIEAHLKDNNINMALKYLIQSYFDKEVLDCQIFNCYFKKVRQQKFEISYQQIGYELYRHSFQPNHLIIDTMKQLVLKSSNKKIIRLLEQDFQLINERIPILQGQKEENVKKEKKQLGVNEEIMAEINNQREALEQEDQDIRLDSDLRNYIISLVRKHTQPLFPSNGRIILHNTEIKFMVPKQNGNYDDQKQNQDQSKKFELIEQCTDESREIEDEHEFGYPQQYYDENRIESIRIEKIEILNQNEMQMEKKDNEKDKNQ